MRRRWEAVVPVGVVAVVVAVLLAAAFGPRHDRADHVINGGHGCFFALDYSPDGSELLGLTEFGAAMRLARSGHGAPALFDTRAAVSLVDWQYGRQRPIADVCAPAAVVAWATPGGSRGPEVRTIDMRTGEELLRLEGPARSVALSPDGRLLAVQRERTVQVVGVRRAGSRSGKPPVLCELPIVPSADGRPHCMAWSRSGRRLATADGAVRIRSVARSAASRAAAEVVAPLGGRVCEWIGFLPEDRAIVAASRPRRRPDDVRVDLIDLSRSPAATSATFPAHAAERFALSGDGCVLIAASNPFRKSVSARLLPSGRLLRRWRPKALLSSTVAVSPDGAEAVTVQARGIVEFWRLPSGGAR